MYVVVYNRKTMKEAKEAYKDRPLIGYKWPQINELSYVIDEAIDAAVEFKDTYTPKIFIERY